MMPRAPLERSDKMAASGKGPAMDPWRIFPEVSPEEMRAAAERQAIKGKLRAAMQQKLRDPYAVGNFVSRCQTFKNQHKKIQSFVFTTECLLES